VTSPRILRRSDVGGYRVDPKQQARRLDAKEGSPLGGKGREMNSTMETSLKQISTVSRSFHQASDEVSTQVAGLECALNACGLGVSPWVEEPIFTESEITEPEGTDHLIEINYEYRLGYGMHNGKWGLIASCSWDVTDDDPKITFLRDASREMRLKALYAIPNLLNSLAVQVTALTDEALKKAALAKKIAAGLKQIMSC